MGHNGELFMGKQEVIRRCTQLVTGAPRWCISRSYPLAVLIVTSRHCYLVDIGFISGSSAGETGKYVSNFLCDYLNGSLRDHVTAVVTDNCPSMPCMYRQYMQGLCPNSHHQRCVAHILNLVGGDILNDPVFADLVNLQNKTRSFMKGKKNGNRRARLKAIAGSVPPDPCCTRWTSKYDSLCWFKKNLASFKAFVVKEVSSKAQGGEGSINAQLLEVLALLERPHAMYDLTLTTFRVHYGAMCCCV